MSYQDVNNKWKQSIWQIVVMFILVSLLFFTLPTLSSAQSGVSEPSIQLSIYDVTDDNIVNAGESQMDIPISGKVTGDFRQGDEVTLEINENQYTGTVDAEGFFSISVPGSDLRADSDLIIEGSITTTHEDGQSEIATTTCEYSVELEAAVSIDIDSITSDDIINAEESQMDIPISGKVTGDFWEGDGDLTLVTLEINENQYTGTVDENGMYSISVPGSDLAADNEVSASVSTMDDAGNPAEATTTRPYEVDLEAAVSIEIDSITDDDIINAEEAQMDIPISGKVTGDFRQDDEVTLEINENEYTGTVDENGMYSISVPGSVLAENPYTMVSASISTMDDAGNTAEATTTRPYEVEKDSIIDNEDNDTNDEANEDTPKDSIIDNEDNDTNDEPNEGTPKDSIKEDNQEVTKLPNTGSHRSNTVFYGLILLTMGFYILRKKTHLLSR